MTRTHKKELKKGRWVRAVRAILERTLSEMRSIN